jgi:hypothetical protein
MLQRRFDIVLDTATLCLLKLIVFAGTVSGTVTAVAGIVVCFVNDNSVAISLNMLCITPLSNNSE